MLHVPLGRETGPDAVHTGEVMSLLGVLTEERFDITGCVWLIVNHQCDPSALRLAPNVFHSVSV